MTDAWPYINAMVGFESAPGLRVTISAVEVPVHFDASSYRFILSAVLGVVDKRNPRPTSDLRHILIIAGDASRILDGARQSHRVRRLMHFDSPNPPVPCHFTSRDINEWLLPGRRVSRRHHDRLRLELERQIAVLIAVEAERRFNAIKLDPPAIQ